MKINKRRLLGDFVLTLVLRGISGGIGGAVLVFVFFPFPRHSRSSGSSGGWLNALAHEQMGVAGMYFLLGAAAGCVWGMLTVPEENRPWHVLRRLREREQREAEAQAEAQRLRDPLHR